MKRIWLAVYLNKIANKIFCYSLDALNSDVYKFCTMQKQGDKLCCCWSKEATTRTRSFWHYLA